MKEISMTEALEDKTIETFEFTDEDGQEHCFVVESRFKVGQEDYVALLEVDPSIFEEETGECECAHEHEHLTLHSASEECGCGHDHEEEAEEEEEVNIILAKIVEDSNGEIDIQVPSDEEFEKARIAYEALDE